MIFTRAPRTDEPKPVRKGQVLINWATSTDHKVIGNLYLITSFLFFLLAGVLAMMIRAELAKPGLQFFTQKHYNELFTIHGAVMLLLFATPLFAGVAYDGMP
ncbi:MAG: cytochrome c oxidase subunit [Sphaerisporangium sp.]|nr:cytochrome c oxidase subunit [Sphaerisporangium sp.]